MELKINRGVKTFDVFDTDGTPAGKIRLNLSDPGMAARWEELGNEFDQIKAEDLTISDTLELDKRLKAKLDYALGSEVSPVLFGGLSCLALCEDGKLVFENILEALAPLIEEAQTIAANSAEKRIKQRTAAYEGSNAGLAPGQQA